MIYAGVGIALLPDFMAESNFVHMDELVKIPFNTAQTAEFGVLYHKDYLSPNITAFLDIIFKEYHARTKQSSFHFKMKGF